MKTDIQIAQEAVLEPISDVAASLGLDGESLIPYGKYKAKVDHRLVKKLAEKYRAQVKVESRLGEGSRFEIRFVREM